MTRLEIAAHIIPGITSSIFCTPDVTYHEVATRALEQADALIAAHNATPDIVARIVDDLMTSGNGEKADQLELFQGTKMLGGWSRTALSLRISRHLKP